VTNISPPKIGRRRFAAFKLRRYRLSGHLDFMAQVFMPLQPLVSLNVI